MILPSTRYSEILEMSIGWAPEDFVDLVNHVAGKDIGEFIRETVRKELAAKGIELSELPPIEKRPQEAMREPSPGNPEKGIKAYTVSVLAMPSDWYEQIKSVFEESVGRNIKRMCMDRIKRESAN